MKKLITITILVLDVVFVCGSARAQTAAFNGFCQDGGVFVSTVGTNSTTKVQASYPKCTVTVYVTGTTNLAVLNANASGAPLANPFQANTDGSILFYAPTSACYDIVTSVSTSGGTPPMPNPFTYTGVCLGGGGGGGGGGVNPGTPKQVTRYDSSGTNIEDSTGGPDDGTNPVPWVNGLSVNDSGYNKHRPNGAACTVQNLLVKYDGNQISNRSSVTTAALSEQHVIGVAGQGAGCAGDVQIVDHAYHACLFDNQTVIGDAVIASTSVQGDCSDGGGTVQGTQVVGRVASLNTGAGTLAVVDFFTGDTSQAAGTITSCATGGSNAYFPGIGQVVSCDPFIQDDGSGGLTFTNPAYAGNYYQTQGPQPNAAPANSVMEYAPTAVTTYSEQRPGTIGTTGQTRVINSIGTDANGHPIAVEAWGSAGGVEAQTNSVDNANCVAGVCPLLNLIAGTNITLTNTSGGNVQIAASLAAGPQMGSPVAPTLAVGGTPGAATVTYLVQGCQDGLICAYHTLPSATATVNTANATLSSSPITLSAYQTTSGQPPRCYNVYRTVGGPSQGKIATCVAKTFIDTGLTGDGTTATNTNTTVLDANGLTAPLPGCNKIPAAPWGIDGPPCSPNALDDEFTSTFGAPGDANNPFWTWQAQGSCTATWTGGMMNISCPATGSNSLHCLLETAPATPYKFQDLHFGNYTETSNGTEFGIGFFESASGKFMTITTLTDQGETVVRHWTNATTSSNVVVGSPGSGPINGFSFRLEADGTNLILDSSPDNIIYTQQRTEVKNSFFTTAPDKVGVCVNSFSAVNGDYDYWRRTQ